MGCGYKIDHVEQVNTEKMDRYGEAVNWYVEWC